MKFYRLQNQAGNSCNVRSLYSKSYGTKSTKHWVEGMIRNLFSVLAQGGKND